MRITYPYTDNLSAYARHKHAQQRTEAPHTVFLRYRDAKQAARPPHETRTHPAHPTRTPHAARTPHGCGGFLSSAHTKRARTIRSGRATYSAQALGRLPWFAPCLRRSRRLRPRFDMSFSLGLLSRLKHFCTHWPQPPRHNATAATKVTEKRRPAQASSRRARPAMTRSAPGDGHA